MSAVASRSHRIETIHEMLSHYSDALAEAPGAGAGGARTESRLLGFDSETYTDAFRELTRCLDRLRFLAGHGRPMIEKGVSSSAAWWAVRARYLEAETRRREVHLRRTHSGQRVPVALPRNMEVIARATILTGGSQSMLVRVWDERVRPEIVAAALRWISSEYRGRPSVYSERES